MSSSITSKNKDVSQNSGTRFPGTFIITPLHEDLHSSGLMQQNTSPGVACPNTPDPLASLEPRTSGVQDVAHGVQQAGKGAEEDDEGDDAGVEQGLAAQHVGQLRDANSYAERDSVLVLVRTQCMMTASAPTQSTRGGCEWPSKHVAEVRTGVAASRRRV
eukprot:1148563-Pelagomonas_calceolata.AAC.4